MFRNPAREPTLALLAAAGLPTADLADAMLGHFLGCGGPAGLDGVVGVELHGTAGLLRSLAVAEPMRGRGLGIALVEAAERHARDEGVREMFLLTETARGLFERLGYRAIERAAAPAAIRATPEFTSLCPDSAILMSRRLDAA